MKKQLEGNLNETRVVEHENELKYLKKKEKDLQEEKNTLLSISKEQEKAINSVKSIQDFDSKIRTLAQSIFDKRTRYKELKTQNVNDDKMLRDKHERAIILEEKIHQIKDEITWFRSQ